MDGTFSWYKVDDDTLRNHKTSIKLPSPCADTETEEGEGISPYDAIMFLRKVANDTLTKRDQELRILHLRAWYEFDQAYERPITASSINTCLVLGNDVDPTQVFINTWHTYEEI